MDEPRPATIRNIGPARHFEALAVGKRPLKIGKAMSAEDAFRVTLFECLAHVAGNVAAVTRSREVEGLHQLRVGLRRLGVAFSAFGEEFHTPAMAELQARTKAFASAIAPARDLDVFADELFEEPAASCGSEAPFTLLRDRLERARMQAWDDAVARVSGVEFAILLDDIAAAAQSRHWTSQTAIRSLAPRRLDEYLVKARKRGRHLKTLEQRDCHRLRISLKKLRYAAEFYAPLYKKKKVKRYIQAIKELQDLLGAFNDAGQVRATLSLLTADADIAPRVQSDLYFASGVINGWHCARVARLGKSVMTRWDKFKHAGPFWI
jgi:CHAD domain-containing protein